MPITADRWTVVKSLFERAWEVPAGERDAWLRECTGVDEEVRGEVGRLLAAGGDSLESLPVSLEPENPPQPPQFAVGDCPLGRFEIVGFRGRGGMGEVYAAIDHELGERIALKTLSREHAGRQDLLRHLRREVPLARRIQHAAVCRMFDVHRAEGTPWGDLVLLTMELLDGQTLQERLQDGPLPEEEALRLVTQLASGLDAIHKAGIIHRDLKSGNIMLVGSRAVILDFGLSRDAAPAPQSDSISLFGPGTMEGTPAYMAPEQLKGAPATQRSDVYALGVVLFQCVTGSLPFEAQTPLAIALRKLQETAPLARERAPQVSAAWERAVQACLEREPQKRPASGGDVLALLTARHAPLRTIRLGRRAWLAAGAASLAGVAGWRWLSQPPPLSAQAVVRFKRGEEFLRNRSAESIKAAVAEYQAAIAIEPRYAAAWASLAEAYAAGTNYMFLEPREAKRLAGQAAERALRLDGNLAKAHGALAFVRSADLRRWRDADNLFQRALRIYRQEPLLHTWYAAYLGRAGQHDKAIHHAQVGVMIEPGLFYVNHQLAVEYFRGGRLRQYLDQARELVRLQPLQAISHLSLARALEWHGRFHEAEEELRSAERYQSGPAVLSHWGTLRAAQGNTREAESIAKLLHRAWETQMLETNAIAGLYGKLGHAHKVVEVLQQGCAREDGTVLAAATNPYLREVKRHPVVLAFLRGIGF